jgi:hypothetical protein
MKISDKDLTPRTIDHSLRNVIPKFDEKFGLELFFQKFNLRLDLINVNHFEAFYNNVFKNKTAIPEFKAGLTLKLKKAISDHLESREPNAYDALLISKAKEFINWLEGDVQTEISPKTYAVYHRLLILENVITDFERNQNDNYPKDDIVLFAETTYNQAKGQSFYNYFKDSSNELPSLTHKEKKALKKLVSNKFNLDKYLKINR